MALCKIDYYSQAMQQKMGVCVIIPENKWGYSLADRPADYRYPTLWLLCGGGFDHTDWIRYTALELYAAKHGIAVVLPGISYAGYVNTAEGDYRWWDQIAYELPDYLRKVFPLSEKREDTYIAGLSMGGTGALTIGLSQPDRFAAIGVLSAGNWVAEKMYTPDIMPVETIASALSIYAGQNHGACRPDRVRQGIFAALRLCLAVSMVIAVVLVAAGGQLAKLFLEAPSVELLAVVRQYLLITAVPSLLAGMMNVFMQTLRGTGHPGKALAGGLVQLGTKILVVAAGAWGFHDLAVVWLGWPLSFITGSIIPAIYCFGMLRRMEQSSQLQANDLEG